MYQGGGLSRIDLRNGDGTSVQPVPHDTTALRFAWNAAIAADPFDANGVYFGSQFVHHSTDRGNTWDVKSPDLTTNDPEKQNQAESGGLTIDATKAENHCTILCIAPNPCVKEKFGSVPMMAASSIRPMEARHGQTTRRASSGSPKGRGSRRFT